jgi:hypothetical protein
MMLDRWRRDGDGVSSEDMYDPASRTWVRKIRFGSRMISLADIGIRMEEI